AVGVWVGVSQLEYAALSLQQTAVSPYYATGSHLAVSSGRLSFTFGLHGPALTVDTACSSSLVTSHLAARSIQSGEVGRALTLGVNLTLASSWTLACNRAGMLAPDGRCKTLDASADGYVRAEGAGGLCLAALPASSSTSGNLPVLAMLAGSAVNQDGRSSSLTAPHGPSQQAVIKAAHASAGVMHLQVTQYELHGTGES
ncbi:thiolase-like protein, partial [Haematococcus lacustris]